MKTTKQNHRDWRRMDYASLDRSAVQLLLDDLDTLERKLGICVEALEFYGNEMKYTVDDYHGVSGEMRQRCVLYGDSEERNDVYSYAGRRARTALAAVRDSEVEK